MDAAELNIDVSAEGARALHRVVRAMHDGHCPNCGYLATATEFELHATEPIDIPTPEGTRQVLATVLSGHRCPSCLFRITGKEERAALAAFRPHFLKSVEVFEAWRNGQPLPLNPEVIETIHVNEKTGEVTYT